MKCCFQTAPIFENFSITALSSAIFRCNLHKPSPTPANGMALQFSFSGHETFPLRISWLKKAVEAVHDDPEIFRSDEAIAEFGVGKNMVRSIRHWGMATGVLKPHPTERYAHAVTDFGEYLIGESGKDPYCEDPATLWLLHWQLCHTPEHCTLWYYVFGHWRSNTLELGTLQPALRRWLEDHEVPIPSAATLKRDFQCLINTYVPPRRSNNLEDSLGCPLSSLGLIQEKDGLHYLQEHHQTRLVPEVFAYGVLDYWKRVAPNRDSLSIEDTLNRNASPGRIFLLSEDRAFDLISQVGRMERPPFEYQDSAGVRQLVRTDKEVDKRAMLDQYYSRAAERRYVTEVTA